MSEFMWRELLEFWDKNTVLQSTLSTDYLACEDKSKAPLIDKIIRVCAALVNLCPPIVSFDWFL